MDGMFDGLGDAVVVVIGACLLIGMAIGFAMGKGWLPWQWVLCVVLGIALVWFGATLARWWR